MKVVYLVTVEVPDEPKLVDKYYVDTWAEEDLVATPKKMAEIVMRERLGFDDDYGFDYTLEWQELTSDILKARA